MILYLSLLVICSWSFGTALAHVGRPTRLLTGDGLVLNQDCRALLFDCDGTICETEQTLTLSQFNEAFQQIPALSHVRWTAMEYGELLKVGASQARLGYYFDANPSLWPDDCKPPAPDFESRRTLFLDSMKALKDDMFEKVWSRGEIQLNAGVERLISSARAKGISVAVCSNSNLKPVQRICAALLGESVASRLHFHCGDQPAYKRHKKPHPAMYLAAAAKFNLQPFHCVVFEDSNVGLMAAAAAGVPAVITPSYYTKLDDFKGAVLVCESIEAAGIHLD